MRWSQALLWLQALITGVTGVVLLVAPDAIPNAFGLRVNGDAHLLCYFYGATELALCFASIATARNRETLGRASFGYFTLVHLTEAGAAALAVSQGAPGAVLTNAAAHIAIAVLFILALAARPMGVERGRQGRSA